MQKLSGHRETALITGASSGIGLEFARILSKAGCNIVIVSNDGDNLQKAAEELNAVPIDSDQPQDRPFAYSVMMDLARKEAADELFGICMRKGLDVDILINNAGMFFWDGMDRKKLETAEKMVILHEITPMRMCVLFGEEMKKRGRGYIINVASSAAQLPFPGLSCYSGTKAFLKNFSKSIYYEYKPYGVRVCALCPAAVKTTLYGLKESLLELGTRILIIQKPSRTARRALIAVKRGNKVCYPAFMCYYLPLLLKITPSPLIRWIWKKAKGMDI